MRVPATMLNYWMSPAVYMDVVPGDPKRSDTAVEMQWKRSRSAVKVQSFCRRSAARSQSDRRQRVIRRKCCYGLRRVLTIGVNRLRAGLDSGNRDGLRH